MFIVYFKLKLTVSYFFVSVCCCFTKPGHSSGIDLTLSSGLTHLYASDNFQLLSSIPIVLPHKPYKPPINSYFLLYGRALFFKFYYFFIMPWDFWGHHSGCLTCTKSTPNIISLPQSAGPTQYNLFLWKLLFLVTTLLPLFSSAAIFEWPSGLLISPKTYFSPSPQGSLLTPIFSTGTAPISS